VAKKAQDNILRQVGTISLNGKYELGGYPGLGLSFFANGIFDDVVVVREVFVCLISTKLLPQNYCETK
jgi:hypothetical protein